MVGKELHKKIFYTFIHLLILLGYVLLFPFEILYRFLLVLFGKISLTLAAFFLGVIFSVLVLFLPLELYRWYRELPQPGMLVKASTNKSTKILDRKGRLLYEIYVDRKFEPVSLNQVPDHLVFATLASEDSNFYEHLGLDFLGIARALRENTRGNDLQGGSTITQQLIKNVLLTPERTLSRKAKEMVLAILVERQYSKNEILELYLNNISYGGTAWGIQSASQKYFAKDVWDLDLAESALLAGLPKAPSVYSPFQGSLELTKTRQKYVLDRMAYLGYIDSEQAKHAYEQELFFSPQLEYIRAPHFVNYIRNELNNLYGARVVDFGGLTITTSLDLDLNDKVQAIVLEEVTKNSYLDLTNGAAVVLDSRSGEILAYVGSVDYFSDDIDGKYDVVTAYRQPGSSIKPVTYALAFEKGYSANFVLDDRRTTFQSDNQRYTPVNYDGRFHGKVTIRQALANSYNIPAVLLVRSVGVHDMVRLGKELGLTNWEVGNDYGLAVTLGGKEVRLLDLANVYATFSRQGVFKRVDGILSVTDVHGFEIFNRGGMQKQVISPGSAYLISNILSDIKARIPAFGTNNSLSIPGRSVAVKTGTTDDKRDNWTFGYTPSFVVGVWVGNNDNSPMNKFLASGLTGASPIWNRVMSLVLEDATDETFEIPEGIILVRDDRCGISEYFNKGNEIPTSICPREEDEGRD